MTGRCFSLSRSAATAIASAAIVAAGVVGCAQGSTQVAVRNQLGAVVVVVFLPASGGQSTAYRVDDGQTALTLVAPAGWQGRAIAFDAATCAQFAVTDIAAQSTLLEVAGDGGFGVTPAFDASAIDARPAPLAEIPC
ncbi:MAG TPA: hypothetical protein VGQ47_00635 [Candidatus Limnocylindrales bacterium]|nr:hypothetical protein [Candidatus Limnocylindrales bacterium]